MTPSADLASPGSTPEQCSEGLPRLLARDAFALALANLVGYTGPCPGATSVTGQAVMSCEKLGYLGSQSAVLALQDNGHGVYFVWHRGDIALLGPHVLRSLNETACFDSLIEQDARQNQYFASRN